MFPGPTELLLIGCLVGSIYTPRFKSNTLTPKTNSQTFGPKETSHVMNGTTFLCLFNIILCRSQCCSQAMSKRLREEDCEERIAAKSRPVKILVSRSRAGSSTLPTWGISDLEVTLHVESTLWRMINTKRMNSCSHKDPSSVNVTHHHEGKPGVEIKIDFLLSKDGPRSWRIPEGLNKSARDPTEKIRSDKKDTSASTVRPVTPNSKIVDKSRMRSDKPAAKARPRTGIPIHSGTWIDVEPGNQRTQCNPVAKMMNTLLRHKPLPRGANWI